MTFVLAVLTTAAFLGVPYMIIQPILEEYYKNN